MGQIFLAVISLNLVNRTSTKIDQVCSRGYDLSGIVLVSMMYVGELNEN